MHHHAICCTPSMTFHSRIEANRRLAKMKAIGSNQVRAEKNTLQVMYIYNPCNNSNTMSSDEHMEGCSTIVANHPMDPPMWLCRVTLTK